MELKLEFSIDNCDNYDMTMPEHPMGPNPPLGGRVLACSVVGQRAEPLIAGKNRSIPAHFGTELPK